jgi:hypothetical protein
VSNYVVTNHRRSAWLSGCTEELESRVLLSGYGAMFDPDLADATDVPPSGDYVLATKWSQSGGTGNPLTLTWSFSNLLNGGMSGITNAQLTAGTIEALQVWSAVAPLRFHQVNDLGTDLPPNNGSDPSYSEGNHARLRFGHHAGFDAGVLAHGYYPHYPLGTLFAPSGLAGDTHYNNARTWSTQPGSGVIDFIEVAVHEIGHNLGLNHEPSPPTGANAIMNPFYGARYSGPGTAFLLQDDINGIRAHYGSGLGYVTNTAGRMFVSGTEANNSFFVSYNSSTNNITITSSGNGSFTRTMSGLTSLEINTRGGNDIIWIDSLPSSFPVTINGGAGNDEVIVGFNSNGHNLDFVNSSINFIGGAGDDRITLLDQANGFSDTFTITSNNLIRTAFPGITYSGVTDITINGGTGNSFWDVNSTSSTATYRINAGDGNDTLRLAQSTSNLTNLGGQVIFNGQAGTNNRVFLQDGSQSLNRTIGITSSSVTRNVFGGLTYSNTHELTYNGGDGVNTFTVSSTHANTPVFINAGAGNDVLNVGTGNLNSLASRVTFNGQTGLDTITINDTTGSTGRNYTVTSSQVNRADFGGLTYSNSTGLTLDAAGGNDSFTVASTAATTPVTINGGAGNDSLSLSQFLLGLPPLFPSFFGDLNNLPGAVTFNGGTGTDTITLHDANGTTGRTYTLASNLVNRSGFGGVTHSSVEGVTLNAAGGSDTFNVNSTSSTTPLTLNGNAGNDQFNINAPPLATINVNGGPPTDSPGDGLRILGTAAANGIYTPHGTISGNGVVNVNGQNINFTGIETPWEGVRVENFNTFRVVTPNSQDDINVGSLIADGLNIISGTSGGVEMARLLFRNVTNFVLDTGANDGVGGGSSSDTVRIAPNGLVATGLAWFRYIGGVGSDTLTVDHGTFRFLNDPSVDTANLRVNVNTDNVGTATVEFTAPLSRIALLGLGTGGNVVLPPGSQKVLVTDNIFNVNSGQIDLTTNGLIVAPGGGVGSLDPAHQALANGYNGGAWNGNGIMSSTAAVTPGRAVGMALSGGIGIGTFMGVPVSSSSLVMRYTYAGDANLDQQVNIADLGILAANWQATPRYWHQGNFNYDDAVNIADLGILAANWQAGATFSETSVVEEEEEEAEALITTIVDDPEVRNEIRKKMAGGPSAQGQAASQGRAGGRGR